MKSRSVTRAAGYVAVAAASVFVSSNVLAAGITLSQCANGGVKEDVSHLECHDGWISGNANQSKAAYAEGQFLPYRVVMTGLTPGAEYTYRFSWDTLKSGKHALDYIGSFDATVTGADLCQGLANCPGEVSVMAIPVDAVVTSNGTTPFVGDITALGGELLEVGPYGYTNTAAVADVQSISVRFEAGGETVILGWGGHIASPSDWGDGNTAADINGSPYHTSNIALLDSSGAAVASGAQDVALSAAAIYVPSSTTVRKIANKPGVFTFSAALDRTTLSPEGEGATWTLADGGSVSFKAQDDGVLTISEIDLPEGDWRIGSITCSKVGTGEVFRYVYGEDPETTTAEFEVNEAGSFECEFVNEFFGAPVLDVVKRVVGTSGECNEAVLLDDQYDARSIRSGETVKYCYWISNTGSDAALDVTLVDDRASLAVPESVSLAGGSAIGGDAGIPDLAPGESLEGELVVKLDVALGSDVINTATASGTGQYDDQEYTASDTATVTADQASSCTLDASVYAGVGGCPGTSTEYVIKGSETDVNWCARVTWDDQAFLDLQGIVVTLQGTSVANGASDMAPNSSQDVAVGTYRDPSDATFTGTLVLTGLEGGLNPVTCSGNATVNVLDPGLNLVKRASTDDICGNADDAHDVEIINGEPVWYCIEVTNTGDATLTNVSIEDDLLGAIVEVPDLEPGDSWSWQSGAQYPAETVTNTAVATSVEPNTGTTIDSDRSSATVTVLSADVRVSKSVDPGSIVLCPPESEELFCSDQDGSGLFDATYTVIVKNLGPNEATGVTVTDDLPDGFIYGGNDGGCSYDGGAHQIVCDLSDMVADAEVTITITGQIDTNGFALPWQSLTNQACARTDPVYLDPDQGNNCDDATTHISTGPTRTIGWWGTHPDGLEACLAEGDIDLGFVVIRTEAYDDEIDATTSTEAGKNRLKSNLIDPVLVGDKDTVADSGLVLAKGLVNAGTSHWKDGTRRSEIDQERVKAGRQLLAAWCNEAVFHSEFDYFFLGWDTIHEVMLGQTCLVDLSPVACDGKNDGEILDLIIASINALGGVADDFNNSGDNLPNGFDAAPADPKAPEDDPTDPTD